MALLEKIFKIKGRNIALFLDGPNILRKEFNINLDVIRSKLSAYGELKQAKVFLNQFAPEKLVEAVVNQGFEPVIGVGGMKEDGTDVDVYMAVSAMEAVHNNSVQIIALATRDADFLPVVQKAKEHGKEVIVIGRMPGFSRGLQNAADVIIDLTPVKRN